MSCNYSTIIGTLSKKVDLQSADTKIRLNTVVKFELGSASKEKTPPRDPRVKKVMHVFNYAKTPNYFPILNYSNHSRAGNCTLSVN